MITFETEEVRGLNPIFSEVETNQLFISNNGFLCQKVTEMSYNYIANAYKLPYAAHIKKVPFGQTITKILPTTTKINF